ncbi:PREDICTED: uncharacterized protein LOC109206227 isoform X2 [Nicotiana attenuata]|uniref:uncharacterized protein LOC109206227 isoform X2 n=1 Tax=Nicotiana attenuata TaxID=49451 RepID=UPI000905A826|nr:PREDICTED: uncharacterized protein LOC109206227 isoform X2 [Nicotiana attenuata]
MREDNDMNGKGDSCCIDGNSKSVNPITDAGAGAGAGAGGTGSGNGEVEGVSSSNNKGKSCKGCLYYSSTFKSNSRNPLCLGLSRSLPQVPRYIVGESEMEASKEGRSLTDFRYACVGYSVYLDQKSRSTDAQETQTELPVCVGLEVLVDKRPSSADAAPAPAHAHAQKKEDGHGVPQPRSHKPTHAAGDEFLTRFTRNANLVAMGVAKNLRKVGNRIKESVDDIFYRRPK